MGRCAAFEVIDSGRDRARWLAARNVGVGGSEIASVLGCGWDPALTVYARKIGAEPEAPETAVMRFGKRYERLLAQDVAQLTGRRTTLDGRLLRSRRWPWLISTLDARQWSAPRTLWGAAELKTTRFHWERDPETELWGGVPQNVYAQVQHQYAVTDYPRIICAGFNRLTCETVWTEVERDDEYIGELVRVAREFMDRVERRDPPPPDDSDAAWRALSHLYPNLRDETVPLDGTWALVAERWLALKAEKRALEKQERELKNQIVAHLGDAQIGVLPDGGRFLARRIERSGHTVQPYSYREVRFAEARAR